MREFQGQIIPLLAGAILLSTGCGENSEILMPLSTQSGLEPVFASGDVWLRVTEPAARVGCAVVAKDDGGNVRSVVLPRNLLPFPSPTVDSAPGLPGHQAILHVVNTSYVSRQGRGRARTFDISCLAPKGVTSHRFALAVFKESRPDRWRSLEARLLAGTVISSHETSDFLSSRLLTETVYPNLPVTNVVMSVQFRPRAYYDDGVFSGDETVPYKRPLQPLAPVRILARQSQNPIIDWSALEREITKNHFSISDLGAWNVSFNWPDCATASDAYLAVDEAARGLEDEGDAMDMAAYSVQNFVCEEPQDVPDGTGKSICIDFFIMTPTILLIGEGDNRGFDPNARYTASRAQLYINPNTGEYTLMLNKTRIRLISQAIGLPQPEKDGIVVDPFRHLPRDVNIQTEANGDLVVQVSLYNGLCSSVGRDHCPSIDSQIRLTPLSNGQYYVQYHGDDYPSIQVNQRIGAQWQELARRKEHPGFLGPTFLLEARKKADDMRNANAMPPNCMIQ